MPETYSRDKRIAKFASHFDVNLKRREYRRLVVMQLRVMTRDSRRVKWTASRNGSSFLDSLNVISTVSDKSVGGGY